MGRSIPNDIGSATHDLVSAVHVRVNLSSFVGDKESSLHSTRFVVVRLNRFFVIQERCAGGIGFPQNNDSDSKAFRFLFDEF